MQKLEMNISQNSGDWVAIPKMKYAITKRATALLLALNCSGKLTLKSKRDARKYMPIKFDANKIAELEVAAVV